MAGRNKTLWLRLSVTQGTQLQSHTNTHFTFPNAVFTFTVVSLWIQFCYDTVRLVENGPLPHSFFRSALPKFFRPSCETPHCWCTVPASLLAAGDAAGFMLTLCPPLLHKGNYWFRLVGRTPRFCPSLRPSLLLPCLRLRWDPLPGSWLRSLLRRLCGTAPPSRLRARPHPGCRISRHSAAPAPPKLASLLMQRFLQHRDGRDQPIWFYIVQLLSQTAEDRMKNNAQIVAYLNTVMLWLWKNEWRQKVRGKNTHHRI